MARGNLLLSVWMWGIPELDHMEPENIGRFGNNIRVLVSAMAKVSAWEKDMVMAAASADRNWCHPVSHTPGKESLPAWSRVLMDRSDNRGLAWEQTDRLIQVRIGFWYRTLRIHRIRGELVCR